MRSRVNFTSAAVTGVPSWNLAASASRKVNTVCSGLTFQAAARPGRGWNVRGW
jgi:hypothetical protein